MTGYYIAPSLGRITVAELASVRRAQHPLTLSGLNSSDGPARKDENSYVVSARVRSAGQTGERGFHQSSLPHGPAPGIPTHSTSDAAILAGIARHLHRTVDRLRPRIVGCHQAPTGVLCAVGVFAVSVSGNGSSGAVSRIWTISCIFGPRFC
jgi:hypothetical protein